MGYNDNRHLNRVLPSPTVLSPAHTVDAAEMVSPILIQMSLLPQAKADHVGRAKIVEAQKVQELLPLLEDEQFRGVSQQNLKDTDYYNDVTKCLCQHYTPQGNKLQWQYKLQTRTQKLGE